MSESIQSVVTLACFALTNEGIATLCMLWPGEELTQISTFGVVVFMHEDTCLCVHDKIVTTSIGTVPFLLPVVTYKHLMSVK